MHAECWYLLYAVVGTHKSLIENCFNFLTLAINLDITTCAYYNQYFELIKIVSTINLLIIQSIKITSEKIILTNKLLHLLISKYNVPTKGWYKFSAENLDNRYHLRYF